jgi:hypothetical protein
MPNMTGMAEVARLRRTVDQLGGQFGNRLN